MEVRRISRIEMIKEDFGSKEKVVTAIAKPALIEYQSSSSSEDMRFATCKASLIFLFFSGFHDFFESIASSLRFAF